MQQDRRPRTGMALGRVLKEQRQHSDEPQAGVATNVASRRLRELRGHLRLSQMGSAGSEGVTSKCDRGSGVKCPSESTYAMQLRVNLHVGSFWACVKLRVWMFKCVNLGP